MDLQKFRKHWFSLYSRTHIVHWKCKAHSQHNLFACSCVHKTLEKFKCTDNCYHKMNDQDKGWKAEVGITEEYLFWLTSMPKKIYLTIDNSINNKRTLIIYSVRWGIKYSVRWSICLWLCADKPVHPLFISVRFLLLYLNDSFIYIIYFIII